MCARGEESTGVRNKKNKMANCWTALPRYYLFRHTDVGRKRPRLEPTGAELHEENLPLTSLRPQAKQWGCSAPECADN